MKRIIFLLLILSVSVLSFGALRAQDDNKTCTNDPNDKSGLPECGTPADNECYDGGAMAGKCDSDWAWIGGWYMARFNRGILAAWQLPSEYASLLPPPPETESGVSGKSNSGSPSCLIVDTVATGALSMSGNWVTALPGQAVVIFSGTTTSGSGSAPPISISSTDTSGSWPGKTQPGEVLLSAKMQIEDGSSGVLLAVTCSVTNV